MTIKYIKGRYGGRMKKKMIGSDGAVSEILGMIMILSITILVIGSIVLFGVPMIESGKNRAKMNVVENSFLSLQNDIEEVVRGPIWIMAPSSVKEKKLLGPSRETEFGLMGGTLNVLPNSTLANKTIISCVPVNCSTNGNNFTMIIPPSNITYTTDDGLMIYENGAIIRQYDSGGPIMVSDPLISIYNNGSNGTVISIHAISINGTLSSVGGDGNSWIETRIDNYSLIVEPSINMPNLNQTNIEIHSRYPEAWRKFFENELNEAGLSSLGNNSDYDIDIINPRTININIRGKEHGNNDDIFLAVYESKLDVRVR